MLPLLLAGLSLASFKCDYPLPLEFELDETLDDTEPPATPRLTDLEIIRGRKKNLVSEEKCEDAGQITVFLDEWDPERGVIAEVLEGELPAGAVVPDYPYEGAGLALIWQEGPPENREPIDLVVALSYVDRAGNIGEPLEVVISDAGAGGCGCDSAPGAPALGWLVLVSLAIRRGRAARG